MKCKACNGTGIDDDRLICYECDGTGEYVPFDLDVELDKLYPTEQTNEEWFCGLSTEEKAEFFVKIEMSAMHPVKRGAVDMEKFIEEVAEWLKQPHNS